MTEVSKRWLRLPWLQVVFFGAGYWLSLELGYALSLSSYANPVFWPPCGLLLTLLLIASPVRWAGFILAALGASLAAGTLHGFTAWASLGLFASDCLNALLAAWLLRRAYGPRFSLASLTKLLGLAVICMVISPAAAAALSAAVITLIFRQGSYLSTWQTWWQAIALGTLIVAPLGLFWLVDSNFRQRSQSRMEAVVMAAVLALGASFIFTRSGIYPYIQAVLIIPLLLWAGLRFGRRGAAAANLLVALIAAWCTVHGMGEFATQYAAASDRIVALQIFLAAILFPNLILAVILAEHWQAGEALRQSESKFRSIIENSSDGIVLIDQNGTILEWNRAQEQIAGLDRSKTVGLPLWEVQDQLLRHRREAPDDIQGRANLLQFIQEMANMPQSYLRVQAIVRPDGSTRAVQSAFFRIPAAEGAMLGSINRDVTDQQRVARTQAAVYRISEATQLSTDLIELIRSTHVIISDLMPAKNFYVALYDWGANLLSFPYYKDEYDAPPPSTALDRGLTAYVLRTGKPLLSTPEVFRRLVEQGEIEVVGTPPVTWLGVPLKTDDKVLGVLAVQNYSEKEPLGQEEIGLLEFVSTQVAAAIKYKGAQEALRESEERFRKLVQNQGEGVCILDGEDCFLFANPAAERNIGVEPGGLPGRYLRDFLSQEAQTLVNHQTQRRRQGETSTYELEIIRPDGEARTLLVTATPRMDHQERFTGTFAVFRDITERKRMEQVLFYLSTHDGLTGLLNRAFFEAELTRLQDGRDYPISLMIADVDDLKKTNDELGHPEGDKMLQKAANLLRSTFRNSDVVARLGGDEFGVILPQTDEVSITQILERLQLHLLQQPDQGYKLSLSFGATTVYSGGNLFEKLRLADDLMYQNKRKKKESRHPAA